MHSKPMRKNSHKERIFTQKQNTQDFEYTKTHRGKVEGVSKLAQNKECKFVGVEEVG